MNPKVDILTFFATFTFLIGAAWLAGRGIVWATIEFACVVYRAVAWVKSRGHTRQAQREKALIYGRHPLRFRNDKLDTYWIDQARWGPGKP